jgi:glucokinase
LDAAIAGEFARRHGVDAACLANLRLDRYDAAVILAADVGGTKTHLALYELGSEPRRPMHERKVASREYPSLEALVRSFLDPLGARPRSATLGIAGPVVNGESDTTNLPWDASAHSLRESLDCGDVVLMNDLEASAWGLASLHPDDLLVLQQGTPARGNQALIAAGTGLGEALVFADEEGGRPSASEGGHADFGPRDELEGELLVWLRARHGHVSWERVVSGPGIADLYRFLGETERARGDAAVAEEFAQAADPTPVVTKAALEGRCPRARLAVERFIRAYGAEAGNLALKALAVGGVFLAGGIAPRLRTMLREGGFIESFHDKGRLRHLMRRMPVAVILRPEIALWGAAAFALGHGVQERP